MTPDAQELDDSESENECFENFLAGKPRIHQHQLKNPKAALHMPGSCFPIHAEH